MTFIIDVINDLLRKKCKLRNEYNRFNYEEFSESFKQCIKWYYYILIWWKWKLSCT